MASILLVTALGMTGAGGTAFLIQRDRAMQHIDERLLSRVETARYVLTGGTATPEGSGNVAAANGPASFTSTRGAIEAVLARVIPNSNESSLGILDGRAAFVPGVDMSFRLESDPAFVSRVVRDVAGEQVILGTASTTLGTLRYIATPIAVVGNPEKGVYVSAFNVDAELTELRSAFGTYALIAAVALVIIGLVGWFVAGRLLRPIRQLRAAASRITASERHERIPVDGRDDVSELTETVNDMLDRLDFAMTSQRQLLDDVRHELKTPITIVRGHLELLDAAKVEDVEATRALAIDELDRMTGLVDDIESFAQSQGAILTRSLTDATELTTAVFAKASGFGGHDWVLVECAAMTIYLDRARITQAWLQLVDNAAKYSPLHSRIELGSTVRDSNIEFWVSDSGPGIPEGAEERIFQRFGRIDTGRGIQGSGLGLAIVRAIATAHGGRVDVVSSSRGSRFSIVIARDPSRVVEEQAHSQGGST